MNSEVRPSAAVCAYLRLISLTAIAFTGDVRGRLSNMAAVFPLAGCHYDVIMDGVAIFHDSGLSACRHPYRGQSRTKSGDDGVFIILYYTLQITIGGRLWWT